jgi:error-prone DNA polymerase
LQAKLLMVEGKLQREGEVVHVIVKRCYDLSKFLRGLSGGNEDIPQMKLSRADERSAPVSDSRMRTEIKETPQKKIYPAARNFK